MISQSIGTSEEPISCLWISIDILVFVASPASLHCRTSVSSRAYDRLPLTEVSGCSIVSSLTTLTGRQTYQQLVPERLATACLIPTSWSSLRRIPNSEWSPIPAFSRIFADCLDCRNPSLFDDDSLGIGFFQKNRPELVLSPRFTEQQNLGVRMDWQAIVDKDLQEEEPSAQRV